MAWYMITQKKSSDYLPTSPEDNEDILFEEPPAFLPDRFLSSPAETEETPDTRTEIKSEDTRHDIASNLSTSSINETKDTPIKDVTVWLQNLSIYLNE